MYYIKNPSRIPAATAEPITPATFGPMADVYKRQEQKSNNKLLLNEVLVKNESNYQDDYGVHSAWIEIFSTSFSSSLLFDFCSLQEEQKPDVYKRQEYHYRFRTFQRTVRRYRCQPAEVSGRDVYKRQPMTCLPPKVEQPPCATSSTPCRKTSC